MDQKVIAIRNIIFDFGGVLFAIDYNAPAREFSKLGWAGFTSEYAQAAQSDVYDRLEIGDISTEDFWNYLYQKMVNVPQQAVRDAWNSILLHPIAERIAAVPQIKNAGYRTFLLSNTNATHVPAFEQMMIDSGDFPNFKAGFEKIHYSQELGMRKPHPETFLHLCQLHGLLPSETLFIDDSIQHVEGAKKAGLQTLHLTPEKDLLLELKSLGILY
jgi:putative hydrolase of the HAD superfamily